MFYLTKERQMLFDAANRYIFDEDVSEEFKQELYTEFDEYERLIPAHFYESIQKKQLFHDEALLTQFEAWCDNVKADFITRSGEQHALREEIAQKLHPSAQQLLQESFHDGEIIRAVQQQAHFMLLLDMSGGFLPHAYVKLTFLDAQLEGELEGYYIYDELQAVKNGFSLRILSSLGYPYKEGTLTFRDVVVEALYRPAVYTEPEDVASWESFKARLRDEMAYFILEDGTFQPIEIDAIHETANGFYMNDLLLGVTYEDVRERILCDRYEDPYAHLSEPLPVEELYDAVFGADNTLRVRALNTLFDKGEEVAPIVVRILSDAVVTEHNEMYFFALANHFYNEQWIDEALFLKWK